MGRWEPDAHGRLLRASIDLFAERGYEATTTAQIAERAGLTRTTLFRLFPDKREILFKGQEMLIVRAVEGIERAPETATPFEILRSSIKNLADGHPASTRATGRALDPIIASSPELQERASFKRVSITNAIHEALTARIGDPRLAGVLADIGVRAYYAGYNTWVASDDPRPMTDAVLEELAEYQRLLGND
ncbi:MAG: TetR family transcriptional regulator [Glaciihabitans sp.]|nr:TetR family transcriptional regulator [Glaciihabitans sp.]